jgi:hypothetical protein
MKLYQAFLSMGLLAGFMACQTAPVPCPETTGIVPEIVREGVEPTKPEATEIYEPIPPVVTPGVGAAGFSSAPSDAVVLFDGTHLDAFYMAQDSTAAKWTINDDGSMTVANRTGNLQTKENFGSVQLHLEWASPYEVKGENQSRSNSGVFIQQRYEVQILDNNDNPTYVNGQVGALYKQKVPLAMASAPTGEWNAYDIVFHAPEFNAAGQKTKSGTLTVFHNGVLIQDHVTIEGTIEYIGWPKNVAHSEAPFSLQDHGDNSRVRFRNIWLRKLDSVL